MKIERAYYLQQDVVKLARDMIGKTLVTAIDDKISSGIITEAEAYAGIRDRASHAYNGRRTRRTEVMYHIGGTAYVYLCYGMHSLFNIVTGDKDVPDAILIRGIKPGNGLEIIRERLQKNIRENDIISGPGRVAKALGIGVAHTGIDLLGNTIWLEYNDLSLNQENIQATPRIGIDYAGNDTLLPYRFVLDQKSVNF